MNAKILGALTILAVALAAYLLLPQQQVQEDDRLFPGLSIEVLNQINRIGIFSAGNETRLERDEQGIWRIPEQQNYPADVVKIRNLLALFADVRTLETKTSDPEFYRKLGVEDPESEGADNVRVDFSTPDSSWSLIVGRTSSQRGKGNYVRKSGDDVSWLIDQTIIADKDAGDWLEQQILHIEEADLKSITIDDAESGKQLEVAREEAGKPLKLKNETGEESGDLIYRIHRLSSVVDYLRFKHLMPAATARSLVQDESRLMAKYTDYDGLEVTIRAYKKNDKEIFTLETGVAEGSSETAREESRTLADLVAGHAYEVPTNVYTALVGSTKEIVGKLGEAEKEEE